MGRLGDIYAARARSRLRARACELFHSLPQLRAHAKTRLWGDAFLEDLAGCRVLCALAVHCLRLRDAICGWSSVTTPSAERALKRFLFAQLHFSLPW